MTSSSGINTAMHTILSVLAQAPFEIFPVYCVYHTVTNKSVSVQLKHG